MTSRSSDSDSNGPDEPRRTSHGHSNPAFRVPHADLFANVQQGGYSTSTPKQANSFRSPIDATTQL